MSFFIYFQLLPPRNFYADWAESGSLGTNFEGNGYEEFGVGLSALVFGSGSWLFFATLN